MSTPFYRDGFFYTGINLVVLSHVMTMMLIRKRMTSYLPSVAASSFMMGIIGHNFGESARKVAIEKYKRKENAVEMKYRAALVRNDGKFLENVENEIKEVFKTAAFTIFSVDLASCGD